MKPSTKTTTRSLLITFALCCLVPRAQAVPPPDGCYPAFTTAEGCQSLRNLTSGAANSGLGWYSLWSDTTGSFNTGVGAATLALNNADNNTAVGAGALLLNNTGAENTASGAFALFNNSTGNHNTASGYYALFNNSSSSNNSAFGWGALASNAFGDYNTASGYLALNSNTDGPGNTATGALALAHNTTGEANTAAGVAALFINSTGVWNTAVGWNALNVSNGNRNTAAGYKALINNTTGDDNTALGYLALAFSGTGSGNIALGANSGSNVATANNVICIGAAGEDFSDTCYIGNIFNQLSFEGVGVFVNSNGKLGTFTSSRRFKKDVQPMDKSSEAILALKPVTFHYKTDTKGTAQFGLIAEEVAEVNPDLVVHDKEEKPYSVRYDQVNAMLLNEFLKEHRKVQELESTVAKQEVIISRVSTIAEKQETTGAEQQKEIGVLKADLEQQRALIQKVSARIVLDTPAPRTVLNKP